MENVNLN